MALIALLIAACSARAADEPLEYQVKAAFLLNFTKFIDWPPTAFQRPDSPIAICVLGENPFGTALSRIVEGEVVSGHRVTVVYPKESPQPRTCQVIFFRGARDSRALADVGPGVLTVGEGEGFLREGGMIAFVLENGRVRFEIDQAKAERAGLTVSAKLLNVARPEGR